MADLLTDEQFEDTKDSLRAWMSSLGDIGKPESVADNGKAYVTVVVDFIADGLDDGVKKFKEAVMENQGTNGFYIRVLPDLVLGKKNVYSLRTRVAPKDKPVPPNG
jgi:hypothetical protein